MAPTKQELQAFIDGLSSVEREQWENGEADIWETNGKLCLVLLGTLRLDDADDDA